MGQGVDLIGTLARVIPERPPPPLDGSRLESVLIVKLSSIGDIIHALPVAPALKRSYPSLRVTWATEERFAPLIRNHQSIDRVVSFPEMAWPRQPRVWARALRQAVGELRADTYDLTLDLQGLAKSAWISVLSKSPMRIARRGQREGAHLFSYGVPMPSERLHAVEEYLQLARVVGAAPKPVEFDLQVRADAAVALGALLGEAGVPTDARLIVLNPSGSKRWAAWPAERWARVADAMSASGQVLVIGSRDQRKRHLQVFREARFRPVDLTGRTALPELVALLNRTTLHIAQDTGSLHIAAALGRRVVGIYGPSRSWRLAPYGQLDSVVDRGDLCGRGCPAYCLRKRRCLNAVTSEAVIEKARRALDLESAGRQTAASRDAHAGG
jgi:heptosyltransferase I